MRIFLGMTLAMTITACTDDRRKDAEASPQNTQQQSISDDLIKNKPVNPVPPCLMGCNNQGAIEFRECMAVPPANLEQCKERARQVRDDCKQNCTP